MCIDIEFIFFNLMNGVPSIVEWHSQQSIVYEIVVHTLAGPFVAMSPCRLAQCELTLVDVNVIARWIAHCPCGGTPARYSLYSR